MKESHDHPPSPNMWTHPWVEWTDVFELCFSSIFFFPSSFLLHELSCSFHFVFPLFLLILLPVAFCLGECPAPGGSGLSTVDSSKTLHILTHTHSPHTHASIRQCESSPLTALLSIRASCASCAHRRVLVAAAAVLDFWIKQFVRVMDSQSPALMKLSEEQLKVLEDSFKGCKYPDETMLMLVAAECGLSEQDTQVRL